MADEAAVHRCLNGAASLTMFQVELPIEVIVDIMSYLDLPDRICAGQVCRIWHDASRDMQFLNKETVVLRDDLFRSLQVLESSDRRILHLILQEVELAGTKVDQFLDRFCPHLRSLTIENCDLSAKCFSDILKRCSSLESLSVINCRELLISGRILDSQADIQELCQTLRKLRILNLDRNRYLSDSLFSRFMCIAPNIEELSLSGCQVSFHSGLYKKFYPAKVSESGVIMASESVLTFPYILHHVSSNPHKIKRLKFGDTLLDNTALIKLAALPKLRLTSLHAQSCNQLSHLGIAAIASNQESIRNLNLSQCTRIVDPSLLSICTSMTNLTSLNLKRCRAITNESIAEFHCLKNLVDLDLSYCESVSSIGVERGLCSRVNDKFQRLCLTALTLHEETVCRLAVSLPGLTWLDLCWCFNAITDKSIQAICCNLIWLRTLKLTACDKLTDAGLTGMGMGDPSFPRKVSLQDENSPDNFSSRDILTPTYPNIAVRNISLRSRAEQDIVNDAKRKMMVSQMCEDQYLKLTGSGYSLACIRGLQELDLMGCNRITDVSLKYAIRFKELRYLNLGQCQQITHSGVACLAEHNPSIETLDMSQCYNITDNVIVSISRSMLRLKFLHLQKCVQLTDSSLLAIGRHCRSLRYLDVSNCHNMSLDEAENLEHLMPSLHTLTYTGLAAKTLLPEPPVKPPPKPPSKGFRFLSKR